MSQTTPSEVQLRANLKALMITRNIRGVDMGVGFLSEKTVNEMLALFQKAQQQLLTEIMEQKVDKGTDHQWFYVPISVIEKYLKEEK